MNTYLAQNAKKSRRYEESNQDEFDNIKIEATERERSGYMCAFENVSIEPNADEPLTDENLS